MSDNELGQKIKSLVREGTVCAVFPEKMTARVTFEDKDDNVSAELPILTTGSAKNKAFWLPDIDDVVVCLFAPNDEESGTGWILGTRFNEVDKTPSNVDADTTRREYSDGTYTSYNRKSHEMEINCKGNLKITCEGDITIKGRNIFLN